MSHLLELEVNGSVLRTGDGILDGRQVRLLAGLSPPSGHVLIRTDGGFARSIGLEEEVRLEPGVRPTFRASESDRTYSLTVDERGWEWGADRIDAAEIRRIAGIGPDRELFLDSDRDTPIEEDGSVPLSGGGVEHVRSRKVSPKLVRIHVNGRVREVEPGRLSFEQLIALAFATPPAGAQLAFTVSWRKGPQPRPEGSLLPGESVRVIEGMTFHVTATDKS